MSVRSPNAQRWFEMMQAQHMKAQAESMRAFRASLRAGSATVALNMTAAELESMTGLSVDDLNPTDSVRIRVSPQERVATGPDISSPLVFVDAAFFHRRVPLSELPADLLERMTELALGTAPAATDMTYPVDFLNQGDGWAMNMLAMKAFIAVGRCAPETMCQWERLHQCSVGLDDQEADVWRISAMGAEAYATGEVLWDLYEQSLEELKAQP